MLRCAQHDTSFYHKLISDGYLFSEVSFFHVKERDPEYPLTEDRCLMSASFHSVEARDEFDTISFSRSPADDLTFFFQSEWGFKINAAAVELIPLLHSR